MPPPSEAFPVCFGTAGSDVQRTPAISAAQEDEAAQLGASEKSG